MNVSRSGPVYTNSDTFQWWIQGRGRGPGPPLIFLRPPPSPPPPFIWRSGFATALKPQVFFSRFRVDGALKLHGERSHKDAVSVTGFRVGGKSIRETKCERVLNFAFFLPAGVESSQILQRRHSRTVSVGAANPRPFTDSKNSLVPNNLHPNNKIEQPHTMSVPNGTVMSERPSSPQKPKRPVSCRSALNLWNL